MFFAHPRADAAVALRRADEAAETVGREVPGLGTREPLLRIITAQGATA